MDEVSPLLAEWDYGSYEGLTTAQIRESVPDWLIWTHGCPGGESVAQVSDRADRAVALALEHMASRDVLFVGHSHFSRSVITRWVELPLVEGSRFWMLAALDRCLRVRAWGATARCARIDRHPEAIAPG